MIWLWLWACSAPEGTLPKVSCQPEAPLRARCEVDTRLPAIARFGDRSEPVIDGVVTVWGVGAGEHRVTVEGAGFRVTGTATVEPVDLGLDVRLDGSTPPFDAVLADVQCGGADAPNHAVVVGVDGTLRWVSPPLDPSIGMVALDGPRGVMVAERREVVTRMGWRGELAQIEGDWPVHHDYFADGDQVIALTAGAYRWPDGLLYVIDAVDRLEPDGEVSWRWELAPELEGVDLEGRGANGFWADIYPGGRDVSHGNAVTPTPDGDLLVSLRWFSTVLKLAGPDAPDAGTVRWVLAPEGMPLASDFVFAGPEGSVLPFTGQHHALLHEDGSLSVFDNGPVDGVSRMARYALADGVATLVEEVGLDQRCAILGGAYPTDDGGWLLTCADTRELLYAAPGSDRPTWTMELACTDGTPYTVNRGRPLRWP